ncbi:MAG TPA: ABC transporter permease subunit [Nitrososphaerales archaeon]|nr:ABC transporter permease subunit [Nitrososphaerales archaeon]
MDTRLKSATVQAVIILLFLLVWQLLRSWNIVNHLFLAAPSELLTRSAFAAFPGYLHYFGTTVNEILIAYAIAAVIGILGGFLLSRSNYVYKVLEPFIVWGYAIPKIALFPVFLKLFGLGSTTVIVYGAITGLFVILINTVTGVREVDSHLLTVSTSLGIKGTKRYTKVIFPSVVPAIFSGLRQAVIQVVLGVLVAELVLNTIGVGDLIDTLSYSFNVVDLYFVVATVALVMIFVNLALLNVESRLSFWRR